MNEIFDRIKLRKKVNLKISILDIVVIYSKKTRKSHKLSLTQYLRTPKIGLFINLETVVIIL